jgi:cell division protein YceG involved in septum cleavage
MKKRLILALVILFVFVLAACSGSGAEQPSYTQAPAPEITLSPLTTPKPAPVKTMKPEALFEPETSQTPEASVKSAEIRVREGDTLERDIIPQLIDAFSLSEKHVKDALASSKSSLIKASGFRRMEGIIVPGTYEVKGERLEYWINEWIIGAEKRYERLTSKVGEKNGLSAGQRIILASVIEGDTNLADSYEDVVAAVYQNRIRKNDRFGNCPTVEYALGYQRPYLTTDDTKVDSKYNTYKYKGLPPGPICCFGDESLRASVSKPSDTKIYFFFYDYVKKEILSFTNIEDFRAAGKESKALFEATFNISRFEKMADKRDFF